MSADYSNHGFTGFSLKTFDFLRGIQVNNNKAWFEDNKQVYQEEVLPFQEYIVIHGFPKINHPIKAICG